MYFMELIQTTSALAGLLMLMMLSAQLKRYLRGSGKAGL